MVETILLLTMVATAVGLVTVVLLQKKGSGVGAVFGGGSESYRSKRGAEKFLHYTTVALAFIFALVPFVLLFIR